MGSTFIFDLNTLLVPLSIVSGLFALSTGGLLVARSFFRFRAQVNQSIAMDVELVRVTKKVERSGEQKPADAWKEEVLVMEKLLEAMASFKRSVHPIRRFFYESPTIVFEISNPAGSEEILFFISMPKRFRDGIEKQIHSFFPDAVIEKASDYTIFAPGSATAVSELELRKTFALPLRTYRAMGTDSLDEIATAMSKMDTEEEGAVIQLVLAPTDGNAWRKQGREIAQRMQQGKRLKQAIESPLSSHASFAKSVGKAVMTEASNSATSGLSSSREQDSAEKIVSLTPEEQELVKAIETKAGQPAFRVNIRLLASAKSWSRAEQLLSHMENAFTQFEYAEVNSLRVKRRMKSKQAAFDYIFRNFDPESAALLSAEEVATIFHFPISVTETPKIKWLKAGASAPPINIPKEGLPLGYNDYRGVRTDIRLTDDDRRRHLYVVGQTGTGKSYFIEGLAKWDARAGHGFCFIDPHGDAIENILASIPRERADDVIVFDPSDTERPIGLNMLEFDPKHPEQKTFVINEMIGIFDQLYDLRNTGGPMFEQYMRNAMLLIMEHPESGSTLMEISRVLADEEFRKMKLSHCKNPIVRDFWTKEAEKAGGDAALANMVPYITSKLTTFISNDIMRPIISQQVSGIDFRDVMDGGKILLVNLSKGKIGEINARLLGMVIVGKLLMAALARVDTPENERKDFYLYMDEFQNVTTDSIAQILSEARKYRLDLVIAHQFIGQLKDEISKAVFGNVGSMVALRVGPEDADFLEKQFAPVFSANDLMNVDNRQGFARLLINGEQTKPFNLKTLPSPSGDRRVAEALKELSRLRHGRDATIVNREILGRVDQFLRVSREIGG